MLLRNFLQGGPILSLLEETSRKKEPPPQVILRTPAVLSDFHEPKLSEHSAHLLLVRLVCEKTELPFHLGAKQGSFGKFVQHISVLCEKTLAWLRLVRFGRLKKKPPACDVSLMGWSGTLSRSSRLQGNPKRQTLNRTNCEPEPRHAVPNANTGCEALEVGFDLSELFDFMTLPLPSSK